MVDTRMRQNTRRHDESGFTLIELLVVILIIGVLAAIAVPMFLNQRTAAVESSVKSDLRNAATAMHSELSKNSGKFPTALPNYTNFSEGNLISVVKSKSGPGEFCLTGTNEDHDVVASFSSSAGGFVDQCEDVSSGQSFAAANADKKVLVFENVQAERSPGYFKNVLAAQGYPEANITSTTTLTMDQLEGIDLLVVAFQAWGPVEQDDQDIYEFYDRGGKVLVEGNDSTLLRFATHVNIPGGRAGKVGFTATYNSLSPSFPYSFQNTAFSADNWNCPVSLSGGAVAISTSTSDGNECITMYGARNDAGGQLVYLSMVNNAQQNIEFSQAYAALSWLGS